MPATLHRRRVSRRALQGQGAADPQRAADGAERRHLRRGHRRRQRRPQAASPGMTANVTFVYAEKDDVLRVPERGAALQAAAGAARAGGPSGSAAAAQRRRRQRGAAAARRAATARRAGGAGQAMAAAARRAIGRTVWVLRGDQPTPVQRHGRRLRRHASPRSSRATLHEGDAGRSPTSTSGGERGGPPAGRPARSGGCSRSVPSLIAARRGHEGLPAWATSRCTRCAASTSTIDAGEFVAVMGIVGLGQVDADEHPRLPRPADGGQLPPRRARGVARSSRDELADVRNQTLGFVFQSFNLLSRTSALENVELPLLYAGVAGARAARAGAARRSSASASASALDHHPNQLSGGQQQRVAIARAIVDQPKAHPRRRADRQPRLADQHRGDGAVPGARARAASPSCSSRTSPTSPSTPRASWSCATAASQSDDAADGRRTAATAARGDAGRARRSP